MDPSNSLTFCVRLNYKRLGEKSYVFFVESAQEGGEPFLWVKANYPNSWFGFGNFETSMAYSNWILNDPINEEFRLDWIYFFRQITTFIKPKARRTFMNVAIWRKKYMLDQYLISEVILLIDAFASVIFNLEGFPKSWYSFSPW